MEGLNSAFFFVIEKIISLQKFFWNEAWAIGRTVLLIALLSAAVNFAISGTGLKDSLAKIGKAVFFFAVVMAAYPWIVGRITQYTFEKALASAWSGKMQSYFDGARNDIAEAADPGEATGIRETYGIIATRSTEVSGDRDPAAYFGDVLSMQESDRMTYTCVAPAAVLRIVLLVAGECLRFSDEAPRGAFGISDFGVVLKGVVCGFFIIFTGVLAVLEYLMAFIEFMFITSVGIILFPLSLWEGTKFMAEKLIGAIAGFFIKLLFCNICIFLMLYGFLTLAKDFVAVPFTGVPDEIVSVVFTCLLFFFICKSAPGLAQSLLTGTPSLTASGAITAASGAIAGAATVLSAGKAAGRGLVGGMARTAFAGGGMLEQAAAASNAVADQGGTNRQRDTAFIRSLGGSAKEAVLAAGGNLTRSLLGGKGGQGPGGVNSHSQLQHHLAARNEDGSRQTLRQYRDERRREGALVGLQYAARHGIGTTEPSEAPPPPAATPEAPPASGKEA